MAPPRQTGSGFFAVIRAAMEVRGSASGAAVRAWSQSWSGGGLALIILCLAVYLPGLWSIPPVDRDESRFAQASRTMLESGDFVVPRIGATPRLNKPPLIYWLQSASAAALGDGPGADGLGQWGNGNIWVFRLPSALCAIGSVLLTWRLGLRMFDPRAAILGAALLAACPMVIWDAHQARADQLLLFTTTGAMLALFECWSSLSSTALQSRPGRPHVRSLLLLWVCIALGILTKGPITPMIVLLTAIALSIASRNFRWLLKLNPLLGVIIITALVGPWVCLVGQRVGWSRYLSIVMDETLGRSIKDAEHHWGPPGYHLVLLTVLFWPGSLLTAAAVVRAFHKSAGVKGGKEGATLAARLINALKARFRPIPETFLLAWIIPSWLVFELIATKLPHYTMPLYPAIALLSGRMAFAASKCARPIGNRIGSVVWGGIGFIGLSLSAAIVIAFGGIEPENARYWTLGTAIMGFALFMGLALHGLRDRRFIRAHVLAIYPIAIWCWLVLGWAVPSANEFRVSTRLANVVNAISPSATGLSSSIGGAPVALVGFEEDSAIFLLRGRGERLQDTRALQDWIPAHPGGIVAVETLTRTDAYHVAQDLLESKAVIEGYNYSIGRKVRVEIFGPRSK